jgi:hypothetical protein
MQPCSPIIPIFSLTTSTKVSSIIVVVVIVFGNTSHLINLTAILQGHQADINRSRKWRPKAGVFKTSAHATLASPLRRISFTLSYLRRTLGRELSPVLKKTGGARNGERKISFKLHNTSNAHAEL